MTVLGSTVVVNAGVLAGLVMAQLKREGAPYIAIGWAGEALDMRTMVDVFSWPDHRAVYSSLLHWYGLPMWTLGGVTDGKLPDQQAAAEAALTLLADAVSGGHMIHDIGFMESAYTGSLTQVVLCDDIAGWIRAFLRPVEITDEELGLEAIEQVGPGGLFLKHKHTRRHARDRWQPQVFDRRSRDEWLAGGAGGPAAAGSDRRPRRHGGRRRARRPDPRRARRAAAAGRRGRGHRAPCSRRRRRGSGRADVRLRPRASPQGSSGSPSSPIAQNGLKATSQACPSGSAK